MNYIEDNRAPQEHSNDGLPTAMNIDDAGGAQAVVDAQP